MATTPEPEKPRIEVNVRKVDDKIVDLNDLTRSDATPEEVLRAALALALTEGVVVKIDDLKNTASGGVLVYRPRQLKNLPD